MVSCTTKQHWELLLDAGVIMGEGCDERVLIGDNVGEGEFAAVRGDDRDTRGET